ncbi:MAG: HD domain-containing protein [Proteobacteria bacterium]|nr:HD domain-containing protein [Pseudomonadota bacterium]
MKKNVFVADLKEGERIDDLFLVKSAKLGETRAGKPYLVVTVMDRSGEISGPIWDNVEVLQNICVAAEVIRLVGMVQSYREKPQLKIDAAHKVPQEDIEVSLFYPTSARNLEEMADELRAIIQSVANPFLKKILSHFFKKGEWWERFQEAPAAKAIHHAYLGGLLEHSLSVARAGDFLAGHYTGVDRSLLITGALLHDIGKLEELTMAGGLVEYTVRGRLKGHLVIGSEMVAQAADKIREFPEELLEQLQHLILSHHGRQEFGSPTVPMTVEALILSFLDDLDAKMNITEQLRRKMEGTELSWTEYQRSLERFLYLGGIQKQEAQQDDTRAENSSRQPSLF